MLEEYLRRALLLSRGDPVVFVTRPISATLLAVAAILLLLLVSPKLPRQARRGVPGIASDVSQYIADQRARRSRP